MPTGMAQVPVLLGSALDGRHILHPIPHGEAMEEGRGPFFLSENLPLLNSVTGKQKHAVQVKPEVTLLGVG